MPQVGFLRVNGVAHEPPLLRAGPSWRSSRHGGQGSWLGCKEGGLLGVLAVLVPHVPGHPTSICNEGVKPFWGYMKIAK